MRERRRDAARQLTDDKALVALGDALAGACIHGGAPREPPAGATPAQAAVAIVTRAAWLQALFVIVFRTKRVPSSVAAADVFGVALEAARFSGDATVRRGGLVLLSSLVGVDSELWTKLPPASAAQARNAPRAVAAADPEGVAGARGPAVSAVDGDRRGAARDYSGHAGRRRR